MTVYLCGSLSVSSESPPSCGWPEYLELKIETYGEADMGGAGGGAGIPENLVLMTSAIGAGADDFRIVRLPIAEEGAVMKLVPGGVWGWSVYLDASC
jgi:hypothetical protein